jgi:hypothetical protein
MEANKFRSAIWKAAKKIAKEGPSASASAAKTLGIEESESFKTMVEKTHAAGLGSMPARSELCKWMRDEGLLKSPSASDGAAKKGKRGAPGRSARKANGRRGKRTPRAADDGAVIERAREILQKTENLKQFCEAAGIPSASAYKWRSGNETLTARSANRIVEAAEASGTVPSGRRPAKTPARRVLGAARSQIVRRRSTAFDIEADLDLISRARGESRQDTMLRLLQSHMQRPEVRKSIEVLRRHDGAKEELEAALAAI